MKDKILWLILLLAFFLRIAGVSYGLPLTVVGDEPPFVLAALEMIQLHTIVPALHADAFRAILYYPPYVSYLYLLPFVAAIGAKWLMWHGAHALFSSYLLSDLSVFFEIGRFMMTLLGVASVYLAYKIAESAYRSRAAARIAAFLLATSMLHIALSMVGRHWLPVSFLFLLALFALTRENIPPAKRLFFSLCIAGAGAGVSTVSLLILLPAFWWLVLESGSGFKSLVKSKWTLAGAAAFGVLAPLPLLISTNSQGAVAGGFSLFAHKNIADFLASPVSMLGQTAYSEPVLTLLFIFGLIACWYLRRRFALWLGLSFITYAFAFYLLFEFQPRFALPMVPLYALLAPAAYLVLARYRSAKIIFLLLLLIPLAGAARVSYLAFKNDSRADARAWMLAHAAPGEKIAVYGDLFRLPSNAAGVAALRAADPSAVRKTDEADAALDSPSAPETLNLSNVQNSPFFNALPAYLSQNGYDYAVVQDGWGNDAASSAMRAVEKNSPPVAHWSGFGETASIAESAFSEPLMDLFLPKYFGPSVSVYRLR